MKLHSDPANFTVGQIEIKRNPLTGDWFVYPINNSAPLICHTKPEAKQLAKELQIEHIRKADLNAPLAFGYAASL